MVNDSRLRMVLATPLPEELCVVFEDTDIGLLAAERAGMLSVDVRIGEWS